MSWPDEKRALKRWVSFGMDCMVLQGSLSKCGYVKVPRNHPDAKKDYNDVDVDVHGGLTWRAEDQTGTWFGVRYGPCG